MRAGKYNTVIEQGAVFRRSMIWKDSNNAVIDLTGYTAEMQIRQKKDSETILHTLSTSNGGITITGAQGKIDLFISADTTAEFDFTSAYYDLELNPGDDAEKVRMLEGIISLSKEVTREDES